MPSAQKTTNKKLFTADFEVHASVKMLYPYIQTAGGLSEWFAENVNISPEKVFTFVWDNETHLAKMSSFRLNHFCRFEFSPETEEDKNDPSWFELRLETNELTQTTFIKVTDYSDFEDQEELQDLWEGLMSNLRKVVGG
jgi:START-like superfamily domain